MSNWAVRMWEPNIRVSNLTEQPPQGCCGLGFTYLGPSLGLLGSQAQERPPGKGLHARLTFGWHLGARL